MRTDSLDVYSEMSRDSDVVATLTRGAVVRVGLSVATDEGKMCSVSNADTAQKLGFVECDGLETSGSTVDPPSNSNPPAKALAESKPPASLHDKPVARVGDLMLRKNWAITIRCS